ncbi:MBL fold metallo-hydrolase [bacterium]|nr:MBL fold metallo-hydrolase [bacterium]
MKVKFWGVRGSYPVPGISTNKYGGNTPCIEVRLNNGQLIIIDAGTGIRMLGQELINNGFGSGKGRADILISHTHWDHIQGFPFFKPLFIDGNQFTIHARPSNHLHLKEIISYQNKDCYLPIPFNAVKANLDFVEIDADQKFRIGDAVVKTFKLNHPNIAIGYRIEADGKVFAVVSDTAPFENVLIGEQFIPKPPSTLTEEEERTLGELQFKLNSVLEDVDFMVYDTFFQVNEYVKNPHWGHSTPEHGIDLCLESGVPRMALFHHAPGNTDEILDGMQNYYRLKSKETHVEVIVAREGEEIIL